MDDAVGAGAPGAGESWTGAAGVRFGAGGCFLAAASAGDAAAVGVAGAAAAGRGGRRRRGWRGGCAQRGAGADAGALPGSGVMMLTGGVEAALGNSALVGLPVGIDGGSPATQPRAMSRPSGGAFHDGA